VVASLREFEATLTPTAARGYACRTLRSSPPAPWASSGTSPWHRHDKCRSAPNSDAGLLRLTGDRVPRRQLQPGRRILSQNRATIDPKRATLIVMETNREARLSNRDPNLRTLFIARS